MPIYEFICKKCNSSFEHLVRSSDPPVCPQCGATGEYLEKQLSVPAAHSRGDSLLTRACDSPVGPSCSCCPRFGGPS